MATPDLAPAVSASEPASIADGVERRLDPRVVKLDRIAGWIVTAAISLGSLVVLTFLFLVADNLPGWLKALFGVLWVMVTLILAWSSHRWPEIEHRHASYKVDERGIEIRKGVYWRRVIHVPRSRVQHTDVSQGPIERGFGLGTLVIYTAGTDHARVDLPGLEHSTALRIRDYLLPDDEDAS
jgi:membrane protein YdbS with pleckstrin-like domain